mgnify:CR=1 FL=1
MQFKKVNNKKMRLSNDAKVSKTYIRQVEANSRLAQIIEKSSPKKEDEEIDKSGVYK